MEPKPCGTSVHPLCRAPVLNHFSLVGREPGKALTAAWEPTLPSWWGHWDDDLEGQSHLQSHLSPQS